MLRMGSSNYWVPNSKSFILWEGDPCYKDEIEQDVRHIEVVDNFDENAEVEANPCEVDISIQNMLVKKVSFEEV